MLRELAKDLVLMAVERVADVAREFLEPTEEAPPPGLAEVVEEAEDEDDGPLPRVGIGPEARRMIAEAAAAPILERPKKTRQERTEPARGSLRDRARRRP